ncbi:uncharacterized protein LOC106670106 isoform X3 [Cimex lectularius]|uniref:Uncharacterized protein n=1 Tax=Cimex lectularius TaxID=79782 RepID=A0A8I6S9D5_CIMLE|nr:uncharacterized protein LOC106670106 isoform X3 [Cimex lectularius]XP_014255621.1 uncharacterized protein LOC106670106 isoform X3 [Cimex lectularius]XP_014255622.1 uncharacterized protein LOC106670106 isoform X3 [Cimex lectularius]XP_014255623.1 uncharacterized protein LOC106670106 isoform X3 [Cimex lectularius]
MAKRDGDDNLSPEMQAKMQAAKKLQDELNAKLSQFGQIASNKNMSSVKEYDDLEKELLELKKYAASVKNENDAKLNDMINAMNKKMEKMAKTALEEQASDAKQFLKLVHEVMALFDKLVNLVESMEIAPQEKELMRAQYSQFKSFADMKSNEAHTFLKEVGSLIKKVEAPDNEMKFTVEKLGPKVDEWLNKLQMAKQPVPIIVLVPNQGASQGQGSVPSQGNSRPSTGKK